MADEMPAQLPGQGNFRFRFLNLVFAEQRQTKLRRRYDNFRRLRFVTASNVTESG